jgi:hypothetical protein
MLCLVTYDVNEPHHAAVKEQCKSVGFSDYVEMPDGGRKQLPNTTLIVIAANAEDAVNKFKKQVSLITLSGGLMSPPSPPVRIEKVIVVEYTRCLAEDNSSHRNALADYTETHHKNALADALRKYHD